MECSRFSPLLLWPLGLCLGSGLTFTSSRMALRTQMGEEPQVPSEDSASFPSRGSVRQPGTVGRAGDKTRRDPSRPGTHTPPLCYPARGPHTLDVPARS